jgi:hypothetical protein
MAESEMFNRSLERARAPDLFVVACAHRITVTGTVFTHDFIIYTGVL